MATSTLNRRTTFAALAAAGLGASVIPHLASATATQAQDPKLAEHPIVGAWLTRDMAGTAVPSFYHADGTFVHSSAPTFLMQDGTVGYQSPQNGVWLPDPDNPRGVHFVSIQAQFDAKGTYTGSLTIEGFPVVSEDGTTLFDDFSRSFVTVRDASDEVVAEIHPNPATTPPVIAVRFAADKLAFPPLPKPAATPAG